MKKNNSDLYYGSSDFTMLYKLSQISINDRRQSNQL